MTTTKNDRQSVNFSLRFLVLALYLFASSAFTASCFAAEGEEDQDVKINCSPPSGAAKALEAYATNLLTQQGAASVKVSVKIKAKEAVYVKVSDLPASLIPASNESLQLKAAPSSILPDGALGVSCSGDYEATITASGIINNKVIKNAKSIIKLKL